MTETAEMIIPRSGCWQSEDQVSAWAGSAKGPCVGCLSQDLEKKGHNLAHGLKGYSPSWLGGHGRVHGVRNLRSGLLMSRQNRNQGERIALVCLSSF